MSVESPYLFLFKTFIVLGILMILLALVVPEIRDSSRLVADDIYDDTQDKIQYGFRHVLSDVLKDKYYDIPKDHRRPYKSMIDFYKNRDEILRKNVRDMEKLFKLSLPMGSPMTDGFHILLPKNAQWKDGMIIFDKKVEEEREKMIKYGNDRLEGMRKQIMEKKNNSK